MDKKMYQIFCVDVCFSSYSMDYVLVGAESIEDLQAHIKDIFPDSEYTIQDECDSEYYGLPIGEVVKSPRFNECEMKELMKKPNEEDEEDCIFPYRIRPIKNMYTDTPYAVLDTFAYYE